MDKPFFFIGCKNIRIRIRSKANFQERGNNTYILFRMAKDNSPDQRRINREEYKIMLLALQSKITTEQYNKNLHVLAGFGCALGLIFIYQYSGNPFNFEGIALTLWITMFIAYIWNYESWKNDNL